MHFLVHLSAEEFVVITPTLTPLSNIACIQTQTLDFGPLFSSDHQSDHSQAHEAWALQAQQELAMDQRCLVAPAVC
jgi:hypothetical protein